MNSDSQQEMLPHDRRKDIKFVADGQQGGSFYKEIASGEEWECRHC
jgi:hypothetical protein